MWVCCLVKPSVSLCVAAVRLPRRHSGKGSACPCRRHKRRLSNVYLSIYLSSIYLHTYFNSTFGTRKLVFNWVNTLAFYCFSVPNRGGPVFESELHFTREWLMNPYWLRAPSLFYLAMDNSKDCGTQTT